MATILGGTGDDIISDSTPGDTIDSQGGNDTIFGHAANQFVAAGTGDDVVHLYGDGNATVNGGAGIDTLALEVPSGFAIYNDTVRPTGFYILGQGYTYYLVDVEAYTFNGATNTFSHNVGNYIVNGAGSAVMNGNAYADLLIGGLGNDTMTALAGNDTLNGGGGNDSISGGDGNDTITGGDGNDTLFGGLGDDLLTGGAGVDWLSGESGNDILTDLSGASTLSGGEGSDSLLGLGFLEGGIGDDSLTTNVSTDAANQGLHTTLSGGDGDDTLIDNGGFADLLDGGAGDDSISANGTPTHSDTAVGGDGNDTLVGQYASFSGGEGNDFMAAWGHSTVDGGNGEDLIFVSEDANSISGGDGNDAITARGTNDTIDGGAGDDVIQGHGLLSGSDGNDTISGQGTLNGGNGNDLILAEGGSTVDGGTGVNFAAFAGNSVDYAVLTHGSDLLVMQKGSDLSHAVTVTGINELRFDDLQMNIGDIGIGLIMSGTATDDTIGGNAFADMIDGGDGNDLMSGYGNDDTLSGGEGADTLIGGVGKDRLTGGAGADTFVFLAAADNGVDTIQDFVHGIDQLVFTGADYAFDIGHILTASEFTTGSAAAGVSAQFIWDAAGHTLYWDHDGAGGDAAVAIATFAGAVTLTGSDFHFQ